MQLMPEKRELAKKRRENKAGKERVSEDKAVDDGLHLTEMAAAVIAAAR
jgi:hypothetical protein